MNEYDDVKKLLTIVFENYPQSTRSPVNRDRTFGLPRSCLLFREYSAQYSTLCRVVLLRRYETRGHHHGYVECQLLSISYIDDNNNMRFVQSK